MNDFFKKWHIQNFGLWFIILINCLLTFEYFYDPSSAKVIVGLFWMQSILMGIETVIKILFSKTGEPIQINNKMESSTFFLNFFTALFFCIHFGIFILVFGGMALFMDSLPAGKVGKIPYLMPTMVLMLVGFVIELPGKVLAVRKESPGVISLMFTPYLRLLPFGLIILGNQMPKGFVMPIFLLLKTATDIAYYYLVDKKSHRFMID